MKIFFIALRSLIYGSVFIFLWAWVSLGVRVYDNQLPHVLPVWSDALGDVLMAVGGVLVVWCLSMFVIGGKGTPAPFDPPREFVAVGPYRYVRNPMYIGGWIMLVGFGFYEHSLSILLFSLIWIFLAHLFVIFVEEPSLENRFGVAYIEYKKSIRRWIPRLLY